MQKTSKYFFFIQVCNMHINSNNIVWKGLNKLVVEIFIASKMRTQIHIPIFKKVPSFSFRRKYLYLIIDFSIYFKYHMLEHRMIFNVFRVSLFEHSTRNLKSLRYPISLIFIQRQWLKPCYEQFKYRRQNLPYDCIEFRHGIQDIIYNQYFLNLKVGLVLMLWNF